MVYIEIDEARFRTEDERAWGHLVVRVPLHIGETARARDAAEYGDVRSRGAVHELHERDDGADHDTAQKARAENTQHSRYGDDEFGSARVPQVLQGCDLEQPDDRHENHGRKNGLRKGTQEMREKKNDDQDEAGCHGPRQGCVRAALFVDEGLGHAAAHGEAAAEASREVGRGKCEELLVCVEAPAVLGGKGAADGGRLHGSKQEACERERQQGIEIRPVDLRKARGRKTFGYLTQKLDAPALRAREAPRPRCRRRPQRAPQVCASGRAFPG